MTITEVLSPSNMNYMDAKTDEIRARTERFRREKSQEERSST